MENFHAFANKLADASGAIVKKYYRKLSQFEKKSDKSPVTIADQEVEIKLRELIQEYYPQHAIQGEEFGLTEKDSEYLWVIDPIDGTKSFLIGRPIFGTLIALLKNGEPILGVIDQPMAQDRWLAGKNQGAYLNTKLITSRKNISLSDAVICTTGPDYLTTEGLKKFFHIAEQCSQQIYGGDCYSYGLLAAGYLDIIIESKLKPHDYLPLQVIVAEAGGVCSDWQGNPLTLDSSGDVLACGCPKLHKQLVELLKD